MRHDTDAMEGRLPIEEHNVPIAKMTLHNITNLQANEGQQPQKGELSDIHVGCLRSCPYRHT
jgi:hypothetical protein